MKIIIQISHLTMDLLLYQLFLVHTETEHGIDKENSNFLHYLFHENQLNSFGLHTDDEMLAIPNSHSERERESRGYWEIK